jgi:glutathione S-transferase
LGKIPYLAPSAGDPVPESTSIVEYLEEKFPSAPRLIPADAGVARQVRSADRLADLYLTEPILGLLFQNLGFRPKDDDAAAKARKLIEASYERLEGALAHQEWVCGAFSMADCATIPALFYAQSTAPFNNWPNLTRYFERAKQRPSYAKVLAEFVPFLEALMANRAEAAAA